MRNNNKRQLPTWLEAELIEELRDLSAKLKTTMSYLIRYWIIQGLKEARDAQETN